MHSVKAQLSSKSSQCDYNELGKGKNRLVQLNEFVKTNMLQKIKCLNKKESRPGICQKVYTDEFFKIKFTQSV